MKKQKFKTLFHDSKDPLCSCGSSIDCTIHVLLQCTNFTRQRQNLLNKMRSIDPSILAREETSVIKMFSCGKLDFKESLNKEIINASIGYIISTECFYCLLFSSWSIALCDIQFFLSLTSIFTLCSSSYLVSIIISYFKSRCICQSSLHSVVYLWVLR